MSTMWRALVPLLAVAAAPSCNCGAEPVGAVLVALRTVPQDVVFDDVPVGARTQRTITLVNEGSAPYAPQSAPATQGDPAFAVATPCALPLDPGDFCELSVSFAPRAQAAVQGALRFTLDDGEFLEVPLLGTGTPPSLLLSPAALDFGSVVAGARAEERVTLENVGLVALEVPLVVEGEGFLVDGARAVAVTVPAGTTIDVPVRFVPARGGRFAATLRAEVCGAGCGPAVALTGAGLAPRIDVEPRSVDFGELAVGDVRDIVVTVTNVGAGVLGVSEASLVSPTDTVGVVSSALPAALAEGESVALTVTYAPTSPRALLDATLVLRSGDPVSPQVAVPVDGTVPGPSLEILPGTIHFGVLDEGEERSAGVVVRSIGTVPVELLALSVDSTAFSVPLPPPLTALGPGDALLFDIIARATPSAVGAGGAAGSVRIDAAQGVSVTAALQFLSGTTGCQPRGPDGNVELGGVPVGQGLSGEIVLHNIGDAPCVLERAGPVPGLPFDDGFNWSASRAAVINPGALGAVDIGATPQVAGTVSAFLALQFEGVAVPVLVSATAVGVLGDLQAEPGLLTFGPSVSGCPAAPRTASFVNRGAAPLDVETLELLPPAAPFSFGASPLPVRLAPGATLPVVVSPLTPASLGIFTAVLRGTTESGLVAETRLRLEVTDSGDRVEETFVVSDVSAVDILFIVDNSGSMGDDQTILAENFDRFVSTAFVEDDSVDFHLGVTHTDVEDRGGALVDGFLTRSDNAVAEQFAAQALVGTDGSGLELGLEALRHALEVYDGADNAGFLRAEAALSVVIVTDEEDSGDLAANVDPAFSRPPEAYIESLRAAKSGNVTNTPILFSVVGLPGAMPRYETVAAAFGGSMLDISQADWGESLSTVGAATFGLQRRFTLGNTPSEGSVRVVVDGVEVLDFTVDGAAVLLSDAPPAGAVVEISYLTGCS